MRISLLPLLLLAASAHAQAPSSYPSPATATWVSITAIVVPVATGAVLSANGGDGSVLIATGFLLGPAVGFWTGGIASRSVPGILIRTGGLTLAALGAGSCITDLYSERPSCSTGAQVAVVAGSLVFLGSVVYDLATVGRKVRAHNNERSRAMIVPVFSPRTRRIGASVAIGF